MKQAKVLKALGVSKKRGWGWDDGMQLLHHLRSLPGMDAEGYGKLLRAQIYLNAVKKAVR